jgi:hypothetical protein
MSNDSVTSFGYYPRLRLGLKKRQLPQVEGSQVTILGHVATFTRPDGSLALQTQVPLGQQRKAIKAAAKFNRLSPAAA